MKKLIFIGCALISVVFGTLLYKTHNNDADKFLEDLSDVNQKTQSFLILHGDAFTNKQALQSLTTDEYFMSHFNQSSESDYTDYSIQIDSVLTQATELGFTSMAIVIENFGSFSYPETWVINFDSNKLISSTRCIQHKQS